LNKDQSKVAIFSLIFIAIFLVHLFSQWWVFRTTGIYGGKFFDLQSVLDSEKCFRSNGMKVYNYDKSTVCANGYMYGISLLYLLALLPSFTSSAFVIGIIGLVVTSIVLGKIAGLYWTGTKKSAIFLIASLASPGTWLLVERGNIDQLVLLLLFGTCLAFSKNWDSFGLILLTLSILLKFYTLPLLLACFVILPRKRTKALSLILLICFTPLTLWNISRVHSFPSTWFVSFGLPVIPKYSETLNIFLPSPINYLLGTMLILGFVIVFRALPYFSHLQITRGFFRPSRSLPHVVTAVFGTTFLTCYLSGTNFDYRLVYLAIFGSGLHSKLQGKNIQVPHFSMIFLPTLWCTDFFFGIHLNYAFGIWQFFGDFFVAIFIAQVVVLALGRMSKTESERPKT
jgi:hypothetical protein